MRRPRHGMTLIEMMVVVAIVGILASLATASITTATRVGRVNGASDGLASLFTTARTRALTEHCAYVMQINGPTYVAGAAPLDVPRRPGTVLLYRKNTCASTVGAYEPGLALAQRDRLVQDLSLTEFFVDLTFPVGVIAAGKLTSGSVSIAWRADGTRTVFNDDDADGTSVDTGYAGAINIVVNPAGNTDSARTVVVPVAGPSKAQ